MSRITLSVKFVHASEDDLSQLGELNVLQDQVHTATISKKKGRERWQLCRTRDGALLFEGTLEECMLYAVQVSFKEK